MILQSSKILTIGPDPKLKGGMSTVIFCLSRMMQPFNIIVTNKQGTKIWKLYLFFASIVEIFFYCIFRDVRIVHIHSSNYIDFYRNSVYVVLCKLLSKKVLLHIHGSLFDRFYNKHPYYVKAICRRADALVTVSSCFVAMLRQYDLNKNIYCLPNCIYQPKVCRKTRYSSKLRLLFVGRIDNVKGIFDVLDCLYKYKQQLQNRVELHIAGVGDGDRFQKMVSDYGLSSVVIQHGWVDGKKKEELFSSSDIFIHPSHFESFGISILEAMSYGLPVITTLIGGIPDFFEDGKNGVAVSPGNIDEIYKAILLFVNDSSCISRMGDKCKETSLKYSPVEIENKLQEIYDEYLSS